MQEFEWRTVKDISSCLKSHGFFCVLQVEFHPRLCQAELKSVCEEYGVCFQAYSSLGQGDLVTDPVVLEVAKQCQRTPAQVSPLALLSWVYLCFYCKHFKVLLSLSSGAAAVGGAAGCRCAPKVIKRRPNTGERQTFWLYTERRRHGQTVSFGLWTEVLLGSVRGRLKHQLVSSMMPFCLQFYSGSFFWGFFWRGGVGLFFLKLLQVLCRHFVNFKTKIQHIVVWTLNLWNVTHHMTLLSTISHVLVRTFPFVIG